MERRPEDLRLPYQEAMETPGVSAQEELAVKYLPLVKKMASRLSAALPATLEENDLIGCGLVGLLEAWERFDPAQGIEFPAYASRRIKGAMVDELRKVAWGPRSFFARLKQLQEAEEQLGHQLKRDPTPEELAGQLGWSVSQVEEVWRQHYLYSITSLETFLYGGEEDQGVKLEEVIPAGQDPGEEIPQQEKPKSWRKPWTASPIGNGSS